jgi:hypothetical protein
MRARAVLSIILVVLVGTALSGTVIDPASLRDLASEAALIVRGRVTDVRTVVLAGGAIESVATVAVDRVFKGDGGVFVFVHVPGGHVGRHRQVVVGAPTLSPNHDAVFFLARGDDNGWRPVGLSAGVVRVYRAPVTGRLVVHPVRLVGRGASTGPVIRGDPGRRLVAVEEFEAMVALVMAAAARSPVGGAE